MSKNIIIIGGGISGLATLHYLRKKYTNSPDVSIKLLEKNSNTGGTIQTQRLNNVLFEGGPNGFLNNRPETLKLIDELNLTNELVESNTQAKIRFILLDNQLHILPTGPKSFLKSPLLNPIQKFRALCEPFIADIHTDDESIYTFTQKRFGRRVADIFVDPMVSGIHAGDAKDINLKHAFPRLYALFKKHGSLIKAMKAQKREKNKLGGKLLSFKKGMGTLTEVLSSRYKDSIYTNQIIKNIHHDNSRYHIQTEDTIHSADTLILATPAYVTAQLIKPVHSDLYRLLNTITYAPMVVVGLSFPKDAFLTQPQGFGYLIPSFEKKKILGVLIESNIFPDRADSKSIFFRVMMGGMHHPNILTALSKDDLIKAAIREIQIRYNTQASPTDFFCVSWPKAIPQYTQSYARNSDKIENELNQIPNLKIVSNWWKGVSFNDCIQNACLLADTLDV